MALDWLPTYPDWLPRPRRLAPYLPAAAMEVGVFRTILVGTSYPDEVLRRRSPIATGSVGPISPLPGPVYVPLGWNVTDQPVPRLRRLILHQTLVEPVLSFAGTLTIGWQPLSPAQVPWAKRLSVASQQAFAFPFNAISSPVPLLQQPIAPDQVWAKLRRPWPLVTVTDPHPTLLAPFGVSATLPDPVRRLYRQQPFMFVWASQPTTQSTAWLRQHPDPPKRAPQRWLHDPPVTWFSPLQVTLVTGWEPLMPVAPPVRPRLPGGGVQNLDPIVNPPSPALAWKGWQPDFRLPPARLAIASQQVQTMDWFRPPSPDFAWQGYQPMWLARRTTLPAVHPTVAGQIQQPPAIIQLGWSAIYPDAVARPRRPMPVVPIPINLPATGFDRWSATYPDLLLRAARRPSQPTAFQVSVLADTARSLAWLPDLPILLRAPRPIISGFDIRIPPTPSPADSWCVILFRPEVRSPKLLASSVEQPTLADPALIIPRLLNMEIC